MLKESWMGQLNSPPGTDRTIRFYSTVVAILPILASYASGVPGFSVADAVLMICFGWMILRGYTKRRNDFVIIPGLIYAALYLLLLFNVVTLMIQREPQYANVIIRTVRYGFYLAVIGFCSRQMLDIDFCKAVVKRVSILAGGYIMLQLALYRIFGLVLKGFVPFLPLYVTDYATKDYGALFSQMFRPTSFFLEPAHFARYAVLGVVLYLFDGKKLTVRDCWCAIFISLGILVSTSAQGYLLLAVVWLACLVTRIRDMESTGQRSLFQGMMVVSPLVLLLLFQLPFVQETISRAMNIDLRNDNTAIGARLGGFRYYAGLPGIYKVIGMGFGVVPDGGWLSSAAYWLYGSGWIVFGLYLLYGLICLGKLRGAQRYVLLIFLILFFSDDSFYSHMCVLFVSLSLLRPVKRKVVAQT